MTPMHDDDRYGVGDVVFALAVAGFLTGALAVLGQGLLASAASASPALHEALHVQGLGPGAWARVAQRTADASHGVPSTLQIVWDYVFSTANLAMAALVLWLRPRDSCARLLAIALIGTAGVFNLTSQAVLEQLPMTPLEAFAQTGAHTVTGLSYLFALLLFPDGRPVPRWRLPALAPLYVLAIVGALGVAARVDGTERPGALLVVFGLAVPAAGVAAQGYRLRHTKDSTGHAQARLLFWALLPSVAFGLAYLVSHGLTPTTSALAGRHLPEVPVVLYRSFQPAFGLIPLALFAGLLRYRLWDIERLLRRTIVYAVATMLLGGLYVAFVLIVQQVLGTVAATPLVESRLAVAVTTLLLVAIFRPVRDRVQRVVDRRFHRHEYDVARTVEQFSRRLRDEVAVDRIERALTEVLTEVLEPRESSLWLRDGGGQAPTPSVTRHPPTTEADRAALPG
jgi:hypothetical protein